MVSFLKIIFILTIYSLSARPVYSENFDKDYSIRAAIVFKISWFVNWPEVNNKKVLICSFNDDPTNKDFKNIIGLKSLGRPLFFKSFKNYSSLSDKCSILYVSKKTKSSTYLHHVPRNILTISDEMGFAKHGGMIEIGRRNEQMFFSINLKRIIDSGIVISSELLKLANVVGEDDLNVK